MKDPFEEQQRLVRRVRWAFQNPHIILVLSAILTFGLIGLIS